MRYCADGSAGDSEFNVVTVETGGRAPVPTPRLGNTTCSCGLCGNDAIDALCDRLDRCRRHRRSRSIVLATMPSAVLDRSGSVRDHRRGARRGGVHADGEVLLTREDVGRHNAVDKVIGRMLLDGQLPADGLGLFVSGRASFELVQKAWAAGFGTLIAVSAPTALAVHTARRAGLTLAGFVRDRSPQRLCTRANSARSLNT